MSRSRDKNLDKLKVRARIPQYFRMAAVAVLALTILGIGFGFYSSKNRTAFRLKSEHTRLSTEVVAEVNGYERLETDGDIPKYYIKADRALTYSDDHMEMENIYLQVYDAEGAKWDKLTALKSLYIPEENKNFTAYLAGGVDIQTRDDLKVRAEQITYTKSNETAESQERVEFARENVRGSAIGAVVRIGEKKLDLVSNVEIETFNAQQPDLREGRVTSTSASFDHAAQTIEFRDNVAATITKPNRNIDAAAGRAVIRLLANNGATPTLAHLQLFDSVNIRSTEGNAKPMVLQAGFASYDKHADRFELRNGVHIVTVEGEESTKITGSEANYDQGCGTIWLNGNAEVSQHGEFIRGHTINAQLNSSKKLKHAAVHGNAYLKQTASDRVTEVSADELNAEFGENQQLATVSVLGAGNATLTPTASADYTRVSLSAPKAIRLWFKGPGLIDRMLTDGRTTVHLSVPDNASDSANKRVTADSVRTFFDTEGKFLHKAEAIGNAELFVEPLTAAPENYKTNIRAPRFDCDFYPGTSNAKSCVAGVKTRTSRTPSMPVQGRGEQDLTADRLTAVFSAQTKDVERLDAVGGAKFTELDRSALANQFSYSPGDGLVRLRGGEPTAWDSRARAKAVEIDWSTREQKSFYRGRVSATYYNQQQTGGATPFSDTDRPVYITADSAELDHRQQTGRYVGNARAWQENNYVRAANLLIDPNRGEFFADGAVQSLLYNARRKENGKESTVPVFASAQRMTFNRDSRLIRYEKSVDIRQGPDRITAALANIFLNEKNEIVRSVVENQVTVTQPKRRATGDYAEYVAADESIVLRGNPATVDDAENGSSSGGELRVFMRVNRVLGEGKSKQNVTGRIRSVYKIKSKQ